MKVDTTKIDGWDEMTPEQQRDVLLGIDVPDNKEEINNLKTLLSKANSEAKKYKDEARASLSEAEKKEAERAEEVESLRKQVEILTHNERIQAVRNNYLGLKYTDEEATAAAEALVGGDMDKVFAVQHSVQERQAKEYSANALKSMTPPPAGGSSKMTKEQILAIKDATDRQKAIAENIELFER